MSWIIYACGSIIMFTGLYLVQRTVAVDSKNPRATAVIFNATAVVLALLVFIFSGAFKNFSVDTSPKALGFIALAVFTYGLFERGRFMATKLLDASTYAIVGNISVLVAYICAYFLYSEPLSFSKLIGASLILVALFVVSFDKKIRRTSIFGLLIAIAVCISVGIAWSLDKMGTKLTNPETYSIIVWTAPFIFVAFPLLPLKTLKIEVKKSFSRIFIVAGLNVAGYLLQLNAFQRGDANVIIPFLQLSSFLTVILGILFLNEKQGIKRKIFAVILAIIGVFFLVQ
jgi:uncharacterized membrane protein